MSSKPDNDDCVDEAVAKEMIHGYGISRIMKLWTE